MVKQELRNTVFVLGLAEEEMQPCAHAPPEAHAAGAPESRGYQGGEPAEAQGMGA